MLEKYSIGDRIKVNGEEFVKVADNFWKSKTTDIYQHRLEERVEASGKRKKKEVRDEKDASDEEKEEE